MLNKIFAVNMPKNNLSLRYNASIAKRNYLWDELFCNLFWSPFEAKTRSCHPRIGHVPNYDESSETECEDDETASATSVTSSATPPEADSSPPNPSTVPFRHRCRSCPKAFRFLCQLRNHEATHSSERPWPCNCGKCFKSALALHTHRKRTGHHNWTVRCARCGQSFAKASDMKRHGAGACAKVQARAARNY